MRESLTLGVLVAILTGGMFAVVTTLEGYIGRAIGAINATVLEHLMAAIVAVGAMTAILLRGGFTWEAARPVIPASIVAGVIVLVAVGGVAYAMPRAGVAAGNLAMVFGQMALAVVIDTVGIAGYERIPLSLPRIAGLLLMAAGTYLVLPKSG